jgi:hypothetical protein
MDRLVIAECCRSPRCEEVKPELTCSGVWLLTSANNQGPVYAWNVREPLEAAQEISVRSALLLYQHLQGTPFRRKAPTVIAVSRSKSEFVGSEVGLVLMFCDSEKRYRLCHATVILTNHAPTRTASGSVTPALPVLHHYGRESLAASC